MPLKGAGAKTKKGAKGGKLRRAAGATDVLDQSSTVQPPLPSSDAFARAANAFAELQRSFQAGSLLHTARIPPASTGAPVISVPEIRTASQSPHRPEQDVTEEVVPRGGSPSESSTAGATQAEAVAAVAAVEAAMSGEPGTAPSVLPPELARFASQSRSSGNMASIIPTSARQPAELESMPSNYAPHNHAPTHCSATKADSAASSASGAGSAASLAGSSLAPEVTPLPASRGISQLRRNVRALYDDARSHIRLERDAVHHVVKLQADVAVLQRAFKSLAEAAIEELDEVRHELGGQAETLEQLQRSSEIAVGLQRDVQGLQHAQEMQRERSSEMDRMRSALADQEKRTARLEEEMRQVRAVATSERQELDSAVHALRELGSVLEERQSQMDADVRAVQGALATLSRKQAAVELEIESLASAFRRAALEGWKGSSAGNGIGCPGTTATSSGVHGERAAEATINGRNSSPLPRTKLAHLGLGMSDASCNRSTQHEATASSVSPYCRAEANAAISSRSPCAQPAKTPGDACPSAPHGSDRVGVLADWTSTWPSVDFKGGLTDGRSVRSANAAMALTSLAAADKTYNSGAHEEAQRRLLYTYEDALEAARKEVRASCPSCS